MALQKITVESELSKPVSDWLRNMNYVVWSEVPYYCSKIDLVGRKCNAERKCNKTVHLIGVELKLKWSKSLFHQCYCRQPAVDAVYAATPISPSDKTIDKFKKFGIGMLLVSDVAVSVVSFPQQTNRHAIEHYQDKINYHLDHMDSNDIANDVAGKPCIKNEGPAIDCEMRVSEYKKLNPDANWKDIHKCVPNHYSSHLSMASAMRFAEKKRERKENREVNREVENGT
jgi:hypothetical protein